MKTNLTLAIDEGVLERARVLAAGRRTTVNRLVNEFLAGLVDPDDARSKAVARIHQWLRNPSLDVGARCWTREELHERR